MKNDYEIEDYTYIGKILYNKRKKMFAGTYKWVESLGDASIYNSLYSDDDLIARFSKENSKKDLVVLTAQVKTEIIEDIE